MMKFRRQQEQLPDRAVRQGRGRGDQRKGAMGPYREDGCGAGWPMMYIQQTEVQELDLRAKRTSQ